MSHDSISGFIIGINENGKGFILERPNLDGPDLNWADEMVDTTDMDGFQVPPGVYSATYECETTRSWEGEVDVEDTFSDLKPLWLLPPTSTEDE